MRDRFSLFWIYSVENQLFALQGKMLSDILLLDLVAIRLDVR